jgi:hypothetical protein
LYTSWNGPNPVHRIEYRKVPWLWIGAVYPGNTLDVTEKVDKTVQEGTVVNTKYLNTVTGESPTIWKYLDEKTLEEKEFPSSGFIIGDYADSGNGEARADDSS